MTWDVITMIYNDDPKPNLVPKYYMIYGKGLLAEVDKDGNDTKPSNSVVQQFKSRVSFE